MPQRYIVPLVAPPTPPQLEQDKAAIDEEFNKAFALIDQLASDTAALKVAEAERTEKLDNTLKDVDSVVSDLKAANARREAENRIVADQVRELKSLVPEALQGWKANGDARLDELSQEVASLKKLLENRVGRSAGTSTPVGRGYPPPTANGQSNSKEDKAGSSTNQGGSSANPAASGDASGPANNSSPRQREDSSSRRGGFGADRKAAIPAWQMAAANKSADSAALNGGE